MCSNRTLHSRTPEQRFWSKVDPCRTDGCMIWLGSLNPRGYGTFYSDRVTIKAHHFLIGKPPKGLEWDHLCRNHACVCPADLEAVSHQANVLRGTSPSALAAARTHCIKGHEFTPENTLTIRTKRYCRTCDRLRHRKSRLGLA